MWKHFEEETMQCSLQHFFDGDDGDVDGGDYDVEQLS